MSRKERSNPKKVPLSQDFGTSAELRSVSRSPGADPQKPINTFGTENQKRMKNCGPWKSGNPRSGFPLSHRPECLRRKEKTAVYTKHLTHLSCGRVRTRNARPVRSGSVARWLP